MKNICLLLLCALPIVAQAQVTPEALIGQCPSMPSVATLVAARLNPPDKGPAANAVVEAFLQQINALLEQGKQLGDQVEAAATSDAERIAQQQTGHSVAQLQNMSDDQLMGMAQQMAGKKLAAAGMGNMSLGDLQALEGKSDQEVLAALGNANANAFNGLTAAEVKALEGMTDKQAEAYLQQGDRMQRMQAAAASPQAMARQAETARLTKSVQSQADIAAELKKITDRWAEIDRLNSTDTKEVVLQIDAIHKKYEPQIAAIPRSALVAGHVDAYSESEERAVMGLRSACESECYTLWSNLTGKIQGRIKTKLADAPRYDELMRQQVALSGATATAKVMPTVGLGIASDYLSTTSGVTTYPIMLEK